MKKRAVFLSSSEYSKYTYTKNHPLRSPRITLLTEFMNAEGLLRSEDVVESRYATMDELLTFHELEYIHALMEADRCKCVPKGAREKFNIGSYENPVSPAIFKGSSLAAGSSLQAVDLYIEGGVPFNPAGGMHHAFRNRANGFCFINDPALSIERLRNKGFKKILYLDLDAHHCDGVQDGYYESADVYVVSIHQSPEYSFPFATGFLKERGSGNGKGFNLNVPLPQGVNDTEYLYVVEKVVDYVRDVFEPDVYILQLGCDTLKMDPLSRLALSNRGFLEAFRIIREALGEGIYLGGGGYNPPVVVRAWALIWCEIAQFKIPHRIGSRGRSMLRRVEWNPFEDDEDLSNLYAFLLDPWNEGGVRAEIKSLVLKVKEAVYG